MILFLLIMFGIIVGAATTYFYGHIPFILYVVMLGISVAIAKKVQKQIKPTDDF